MISGSGPFAGDGTTYSLGTIVADMIDGDTSGKGNYRRDDTNRTPSRFTVFRKRLEDWKENGAHDELRDPCTKVTPATNKRICRSNNLFGKHATGPVLTHDKGTSSEADA